MVTFVVTSDGTGNFQTVNDLFKEKLFALISISLNADSIAPIHLNLVSCVNDV